MSLDSEVLKLVQKSMIALIESSSTFPIQAIDVQFTRPNDLKYFELINIPFDQTEYWGTEKTIAGQFNVILHWPVTGSGQYEKIELLEEIASHIPKGHWFRSDARRVQVSQNPRIGQAIRGNYVDGTGFLVADNGTETVTALAVPYQTFKM